MHLSIVQLIRERGWLVGKKREEICFPSGVSDPGNKAIVELVFATYPAGCRTVKALFVFYLSDLLTAAALLIHTKFIVNRVNSSGGATKRLLADVNVWCRCCGYLSVFDRAFKKYIYWLVL